MKLILKGLLKFAMNVLSFFFSYETGKALKYYKNILYSNWLKNSIKNCGKGFYVQSPAYLKGGKYMTIGTDFSSGNRLRIECWDEFADSKFTPSLLIGNNVKMNYNVHIGCIDKISIGNNVLFASNIFISDHQHGYVDHRDIGIAPTKRPLSSNGPVIIEDNVWIGENVAIMPNVTIGEGCIIGANSVVTKSFPKHSVLGGVPARIIKTLNVE